MFITVRILHIVPLSVKIKDKIIQNASLFISWLLLFNFCLILLCSTTSQAAPIAIINANTEKLSLTQYVDILNDDQYTSLDQILGTSLANQFAPIDLSDQAAFAEYNNRFWLRFSIHNTTNEEQIFWLHANDPFFLSLTIYTIKSFNPLSYEEVNNALFQDEYFTPILKEIHIQPNSTATFIAQVNALNKQTSQLEIIKSSKFLAQQINETRLFTFGLGVLFFLVLFSLFFTLYRKSKIFLYYCSFVISHLGIEIIGRGITRDWYPNYAEWKYTAMFCFFYLGTAAALMGTQMYLKSGNSYTRHYHFLTLAQYFNFFSCLIIIFVIDGYSPLVLLPAIITIPTVISALYSFYNENDDRIALFISITLFISSIILIAYLFFSSTLFDLTLFVNPYILYFIITVDTILLILLIIHKDILIEQDSTHQQLVNTNATKFKAQQELLSEISHDIRTPISGILGMADLLKLSSLTTKQQEQVDAVKTSGQTLLDKVSEIHYRIHLQDNTTAIQKHPFELTPLIEVCINSFRMQAESKNIELIAHVQSDVPTIVMGDELRLRQILIKLIDNAIKNTQQGEVIINVSKLASNLNYIHFSIKDTGRGLSTQEITDLGGKNNNSNNKGSAINEKLGIPITRKLLTQLKSELHITSHLGEGSNFSFSLLLPQAAHTSHDNNHILHKILANKKLLVVDDNYTCCKVLRQQASSWGMQVTEAHNGNEALAMFRANMNLKQPFDAIVIDYDMPHLSGIEVAERILTETATPPIMIMLTGLSIAPSDDIAYQAGIATVLTKPSSQKLIRLTLANLFQEKNHDLSTQKNILGKNSQRILVAEDNDVSRGVISRMLENMAVDYKLVANGQLALDAAKRERFNLILMDCKMPIMDGYEATKKIHAWQKEQHQMPTPIIALTAYMPEDNQEERAEAGMISYLEKPILQAELEATIKLYI